MMMMMMETLKGLQWQESCQADQVLQKSSPTQTQLEKTEIANFSLNVKVRTTLLVSRSLVLQKSSPTQTQLERTEMVVYFSVFLVHCKS